MAPPGSGDDTAKSADTTLAATVTRLRTELEATAASAEIDSCIAQVAAGFADARITTYVPVLMERRVRQLLRERALLSGDTSPSTP